MTSFAQLCGDTNPLHTDPTFAATTPFKQPIVHGILVSSAFSTVFGASIEGAVYVSQTLKFVAPVKVGSVVRGEVEVMERKQRRRGVLLTCKTQCKVIGTDKEGEQEEDVLVVDGEAQVLLPRTLQDESS